MRPRRLLPLRSPGSKRVPVVSPTRTTARAGALIVGALLLGMSLLMASYAVATAMDRNGDLLALSLGKVDLEIKHALK